MIAKGMKAYDLVWLEGKSAAWRYPSEIEELKPYAPAVEEQPYDRFYIRKEAGQNDGILVSDTAENVSAKTNKGIAARDHSAYLPQSQDIPRKKVYINFPGSRAGVSALGEQEKPNENEREKMGAASTAYSASAAYDIPEPLPENVNEKLRNQLSSVDWNASAANWSASPAMGNELAASGREKRFSFGSYTTWIIASCLVLGGVLIGLLISNAGQQKNIRDLDSIIKQIQEREKQKIQSAIARPAWTGNTAIDPADNKGQPQTAVEPAGRKKEYRLTGNAMPEAGVHPKNSPLDKPSVSMASNPLPARDIKDAAVRVNTSQQANNRLLNTRQQGEAALSAVAEERSGGASNTPPAADREDLYNLVSVKTGKYKTGVLGGISPLELELTNGSQHTLRNVEVQVNYLGLEKKLIRSQNIYFRNVAPGEQLVKEVPRSSRGVYVECLIARIE